MTLYKCFIKYRSSRSQMFFRLGVQILKVCNFIKKRLQHRRFPVKFVKFLRTPFLAEYLRWLLLKIRHNMGFHFLRMFWVYELTFSEPWKSSKIDPCTKRLKTVHKKFHLRYFTNKRIDFFMF